LRFARGSLPPDRNSGRSRRLGRDRRLEREWIADAVRSRFPKLATALGDQLFAAMLAQYFAREPEARASVRESGARLAGFLASTPEYPIWYSELAALDRAHVEVAHAKPIDTLARRELTHERTLRLVPAHALVTLATASDELWATLDTLPAGSGTWNRTPRELEWPRMVLVWRGTYNIVRDRIAGPDEACALRAAQRGTTLAELHHFFGGANPHATALDAVIEWIDSGLLAR
jgi:hypothetical protein